MKNIQFGEFGTYPSSSYVLIDGITCKDLKHRKQKGYKNLLKALGFKNE